MFSRAALVCILTTAALSAQNAALLELAQTSREAAALRAKARRAITQETLHQRSLTFPPHSHFAVGAATALYSNYILREIVSEYTVAALKGSSPPELIEFRELVSKDGAPIRTPEVARRALLRDIGVGEERIRKQVLEELTKVGLVDVATDYGLMLLMFTKEAIGSLTISPGGDGFVGTEEALWFRWTQTAGGALQFRGRKVARIPMQGKLWIRKSDGHPLRISSWMEHEETRHTLRDEAVVDYIPTAFGCVAPASVLHRHLVDGRPLTENLYTYEPFRLFTTDTTIQYTGDPTKR